MLIKGKVWKYGNDINTDVIKISNIKYDGIVKVQIMSSYVSMVA